MEKKIHESLVRSICLLLGIFVVVGSINAGTSNQCLTNVGYFFVGK